MAVATNEAVEGRIICDARILGGKPVIRGTRISVAFVLECLAGMTEAALLESYPALTKEDVQSALLYAAKVLHGERQLR